MYLLTTSGDVNETSSGNGCSHLAMTVILPIFSQPVWHRTLPWQLEPPPRGGLGKQPDRCDAGRLDHWAGQDGEEPHQVFTEVFEQTN